MSKNIAIILARGGSKRLPGKNTILIDGRPMLAWSIEAAVRSGIFSRILVSTDCEHIADIAIKYGADVPFLRNGAADDHSSSSEATLVALSQAEAYWSEDYNIVAQLMANCPLRSSKDICLAFESFIESQAPSQISCFKLGWMNPWWAARLDDGRHPEWLFPQAHLSRSQDLPNLYCPSGATWLALKSTLNRYKTFYAPGHVLHELNWISAMDIDDQADLCMAKACIELRKSGDLRFCDDGQF